MTAADDATAPLATARPSLGEGIRSVLLYALVGVVLTSFVGLGIDRLMPDFLTDDFAANRIKLGAIYVAIVGGLLGWTIRTNRRYRHFAVYRDRFEVGRPARVTVPLHRIDRIRLAAPPPALARRTAKLNEGLGMVSPKNARAAQGLRAAYANTVVLDVGPRSLVFHLGTVAGGAGIYEALATQRPQALAPPQYTQDELRRFGRFLAGWVERDG